MCNCVCCCHDDLRVIARVHPVYAMNAEQRQLAADLLTTRVRVIVGVAGPVGEPGIPGVYGAPGVVRMGLCVSNYL